MLAMQIYFIRGPKNGLKTEIRSIYCSIIKVLKYIKNSFANWITESLGQGWMTQFLLWYVLHSIRPVYFEKHPSLISDTPSYL